MKTTQCSVCGAIAGITDDRAFCSTCPNVDFVTLELADPPEYGWIMRPATDEEVAQFAGAPDLSEQV